MTGLHPVDPVSFERWAVTAVGGHPVDHPVDAGIDGQIIITTSDGTGEPGRVLIAVKAGDRHHPRMVRDLARTVDTLDAERGVLVCLSPPPPSLYEAAVRTGATSADGLPLVQVLTAAEVASGKRPDGTAA